MPYALANNKRIFYSDASPASGTAHDTLVLIHGLGSSSNYWFPIIPALSQKGYRAVALDYSGAGRSPYTQVEQSVDSYAKDVVALMDHLKIEKGIVVGHSMSGMIGAYLAATYQSRFTAAVLIGSVYPGPEVTKVFDGRIQTVAEKGLEVMADTVPNVGTSKAASSLVRALIRELILGSQAGAAGYISNCRVIANASPVKLGDIKVPALVIAGEDDYATPVDMNKRVFQELGTAEKEKRWVQLANCGHWIVLEKPEEVTEEILKFLVEYLPNKE